MRRHSASEIDESRLKIIVATLECIESREEKRAVEQFPKLNYSKLDSELLP